MVGWAGGRGWVLLACCQDLNLVVKGQVTGRRFTPCMAEFSSLDVCVCVFWGVSLAHNKSEAPVPCWLYCRADRAAVPPPRSADGTARVYNTLTGVCAHTLIGHEGEISKVSFNPQV